MRKLSHANERLQELAFVDQINKSGGVGRSNPLNYGVYPVTDFILAAALTMGHVRKCIVRRVNARLKLCNLLNFFVFIVETATVLDAV